MAEFLLIHGSCHGAWCWQEVLPLLQDSGHDARAIDLPGHGADTTPLKDVTLERYAEAIADNCRGDTVLVGHSMGGYAIGAAACRAPEKIRLLIYLCAYVPADGLSLADRRMQADYQPLLPALRMQPDGISFTVDPEMATDIFYNTCDAHVAKAAIAQLCPQAIAPAEVTFQSTPQMRALPCRYIRCAKDGAVPPQFQVKMTQDWPADHVQEMFCDHSPFLSDPSGLAERLIAAVRH